MNQKELYEMYSHHINDLGFGLELGLNKPASASYFARVFIKHFGSLLSATTKMKKFSKCSVCAESKLQEKQYPATHPAAKKLRLHRFRHVLWVGLNRARYWHHRFKAKMYPKR